MGMLEITRLTFLLAVVVCTFLGVVRGVLPSSRFHGTEDANLVRNPDVPKHPTHKCIHEKHIKEARDSGMFVDGATQSYGTFTSGRKLQGGLNWQYIRIASEFIDFSGPNMDASMNSYLSDFVQTVLVPQTIDRLQNVLKVVPISGKLYAKRTCNYWNGYCPKRYATCSSATCGVSTTFQNNLPINSDYYSTLTTYPTSPTGSTTTLPGGAGISNADFFVRVTARQTASCGTGGSGVAAFLRARRTIR